MQLWLLATHVLHCVKCCQRTGACAMDPISDSIEARIDLFAVAEPPASLSLLTAFVMWNVQLCSSPNVQLVAEARHCVKRRQERGIGACAWSEWSVTPQQSATKARTQLTLCERSYGTSERETAAHGSANDAMLRSKRCAINVACTLSKLN